MHQAIEECAGSQHDFTGMELETESRNHAAHLPLILIEKESHHAVLEERKAFYGVKFLTPAVDIAASV